MTSPRGNAGALAASFVAANLLVGCGGALPLLHPAATLAQGEVRSAGGVSGQFALGGLSSALSEHPMAATSAGPETARKALVLASVGPGVSPFVAARVGLGGQAEGGLSYSGRSVRVDVRRAFGIAPHWDLSAGAGGSAAFSSRQDSDGVPALDLAQLHGWGADAPVLIGYRSDGDLYSAWLGARAGWEYAEVGGAGQSVLPPPAAVAVAVTRFWAGAVLGLAVGFRHLHVAMELDASYVVLSGDYYQSHTQVAGVTLAPATALLWTF